MSAPKDVDVTTEQDSVGETNMNGAAVNGAPMSGVQDSKPANKVRRLVPKRRDFERGDHAEIAAALLKMLPSAAPPKCDLGALHTYDAKRGTWCKVERSDASKIVQSFAGCMVVGGGKPKPLNIYKGDLAGALEFAEHDATDRGFFDRAVRGLAFANGFIRLDEPSKTIALVPHSPEHAARHSYPFDYDAAAKCPQFLALLAAVWSVDPDAAEKTGCLQEYLGACLFGIATRYQRALIMYGPDGANGKSTVATIATACFPEGSTCAIAPQSWGNEYRLALLAGKLFNVVHELPEGDILAADDFKDTIDGSQKTARPIREAPFTFTPRAGHLFGANKLPAFNDTSGGFRRRWIVLPFNRSFTEHEQDATLADRIIAEELAGVVAWLVEGARRVLARGHYAIPASSVAAVRAWTTGADPVAQFVTEKTKPAMNDRERTPSKDVFMAYARWAEANRFKVCSSHTFAARMRNVKDANGMPLALQHTRTGDVYPVALIVPDEAEGYSGVGRAGIGYAEAPVPEPDPDDVAREVTREVST